MQSESEIVVGLDIGTTKIAAIVGKRNEHGKIEILGYGKSDSLGVRRGVVLYIDQTVQAIRQAVAEAEAQSGVDIRIVNVGIAGQHIKSLQHRGMRVRQNTDKEISQDDINAMIDDMYKLVMPPGEEIIHVLPQEYIVDNESGIKDPRGINGIRLEANFHVITGMTTAAKNIQKCVEKSGLRMVNLVLEPLASAASVLSEEEKEAGVALIDIGGGTTDIAIFQDGIIRHSAVIPFGGEVISTDIHEGLSVIKKQAESIKVKFGTALENEAQANEYISIPGLKGREAKEISMKSLAGIIQARMEEILKFVSFEIKNSGYERKLICGTVITGGGSQLRHLPQLTEYVTGMSTRIGYPNEHLAESAIDISSPMYATGVGLVIKGFEQLEKHKSETSTIISHSTKERGSFFDRLLGRTKEWFDEDAELGK